MHIATMAIILDMVNKTNNKTIRKKKKNLGIVNTVFE